MITTLAYDSNDNFSDTSDDTDYFKEKGVNESIKKGSKKSKVITKVGDDDNIYFYFKNKEEKVMNEEMSKVSDMVNDDSDCSYDNDSEKKISDDSDDDRYNGYNEYDEYDRHNRGYYYYNRRYEKRGFPMISPIISPVTI